MVAFANHAVTNAAAGPDVSALKLERLNLGALGDLSIKVVLEPKPPTDDDLRAASAARLPSIAELALFGTEEEPME